MEVVLRTTMAMMQRLRAEMTDMACRMYAWYRDCSTVEAWEWFVARCETRTMINVAFQTMILVVVEPDQSMRAIVWGREAPELMNNAAFK